MGKIEEILDSAAGAKQGEHAAEGTHAPIGGGAPGGPAVNLPVPGAGFDSVSDIGNPLLDQAFHGSEGAISHGSIHSGGSLVDAIGGHNPPAGGHVGSLDNLGDQAAEDALNHSG